MNHCDILERASSKAEDALTRKHHITIHPFILFSSGLQGAGAYRCHRGKWQQTQDIILEIRYLSHSILSELITRQDTYPSAVTYHAPCRRLEQPDHLDILLIVVKIKLYGSSMNPNICKVAPGLSFHYLVHCKLHCNSSQKWLFDYTDFNWIHHLIQKQRWKHLH